MTKRNRMSLCWFNNMTQFVHPEINNSILTSGNIFSDWGNSLSLISITIPSSLYRFIMQDYHKKIFRTCKLGAVKLNELWILSDFLKGGSDESAFKPTTPDWTSDRSVPSQFAYQYLHEQWFQLLTEFGSTLFSVCLGFLVLSSVVISLVLRSRMQLVGEELCAKTSTTWWKRGLFCYILIQHLSKIGCLVLELV